MKFIWNVVFLLIISFVVVSFVFFSTMLIGGFEFDRKLYSVFYFLCCIGSISTGHMLTIANDVYIAKDLKDYLFKGNEK